MIREGYGREDEQDEGKILGLFDDDSFRFHSFPVKITGAEITTFQAQKTKSKNALVEED